MTSTKQIMTYPAPVDLNRYSTYQLYIEDADEHPRNGSPDGWHPTIADLMIEDDALYDIPAGVWYPFLNSGRPGCHYLMRDVTDRLYLIEQERGRYGLSVISRHGGHRDVRGGYDNPYDTFWTAEQQVYLTADATPN